MIHRRSQDRKATLATGAALARRAQAIDPNDITALEALAGAQMFDGDLDGAMLTVRRELEINPSDAHANRDLAATLYFLGRWDEALRQLDIAETLNPLDPSHLDKVHGMATVSLIALGRYDEALVRARHLEAISPHNAAEQCVPTVAVADGARLASRRLNKRERRILTRTDAGESGRVAHWIDARPGSGRRNPPQRRHQC